MAERDIRVINRAVTDDLATCIREEEMRYHGAIHDLACQLTQTGTQRVVLLAGPSSSGKTTTANILADALTALKHPSFVLSLDHFYRDSRDPAYPRLPDGSRDLECVDALQITAVHDTIARLIAGESVPIPHYDFKHGVSTADATTITPCRDGFVIIEGLHALNPRLIEGLPREHIFKLFVSVSTNLEWDGERLLSGRKIRFIRRVTRDYLYRGSSASRTFALWQQVLHGEDLYLYPYKSTADWALDTFHAFELGVLRPFTLQALDAVTDATLQHPYIHTVRRALDTAIPVPLEAVPDTSLIREFVPGGKYEHLY